MCRAPDLDFGQVVVLYLPLLNLVIFVLVSLAFPRSLGNGTQDSSEEESKGTGDGDA